MQERPDVKKRLAYEKEGDEGLPRQLRVKQRSLTMVWNRALSKNCRDIKVCSWPLTVLGYVRCSVDHRSIGDERPQRTKDAVSERTHPLAVRAFVGNGTGSAIGLDAVKRR